MQGVYTVSYTHLDVYKRQVYNREALVARLFAAGYVRRSQVDGPGQFSVRGDIVDIYADVYKRQLRAAALPLILQDVPHVLQGVHGAAQLFVPQLGAQAGIAAPVSYTHLDVYKRQRRTWAGCSAS